MSHRYSLSSALLIVFLLVLASRLPFLGPGYGVDGDGWRAVQSGLHFVQTGEYGYSRQPGYPLQEALGGLVAAQPYWVGNLVTAAMSAVAAVFFLLILRFYGVRDDVLGALALALTPVVYIESTGTMDYVNALACTLAATYAVLTGRIAVAGLLLGLATGFRASSAAMFLPMAVFLLVGARRDGRAFDPLSQAAMLAVTSGGVALLLYAVPIATYGLGLLESYQKVQRQWDAAMWLATVGVFGVPGAIAVVASLAQATARARARTSGHPSSMPAPAGRNHFLLWLLSAAVPVLIYVWQPSEAGYIIPAVPFILLILARYASRRAFVVTCLAIGMSPFVGQFTPRVGDLVPSIVVYQAKRTAEMTKIQALWDELDARPGRTVVIAAAYAPKLMMTQPEATKARVTVVSWATADEILSRRAEGVEVLCFAEACRWNVKRTGADPIQYGAREFAGE